MLELIEEKRNQIIVDRAKNMLNRPLDPDFDPAVALSYFEHYQDQYRRNVLLTDNQVGESNYSDGTKTFEFIAEAESWGDEHIWETEDEDFPYAKAQHLHGFIFTPANKSLSLTLNTVDSVGDVDCFYQSPEVSLELELTPQVESWNKIEKRQFVQNIQLDSTNYFRGWLQYYLHCLELSEDIPISDCRDFPTNEKYSESEVIKMINDNLTYLEMK